MFYLKGLYEETEWKCQDTIVDCRNVTQTASVGGRVWDECPALVLHCSVPVTPGFLAYTAGV